MVYLNVLLLNDTDLSRILDIDGKRLATNPAEFSKRNKQLYRLAVDTWLLLCRGISGDRPAFALRNHITRYGLVATISECNSLANRLIHSEFSSSDLGPLACLIVEDERDTLQQLRYLKKFSPSAADKLEQESIDTLLSINRKHARSEKPLPVGYYWNPVRGQYWVDVDAAPVIAPVYPAWLLAEVRHWTEQMLWEECPSDYYLNGTFSSGASAEGDRTMADKVASYGAVAGYLFDLSYPLTRQPLCQPLDYVNVICVPKSYKAVRVIAEAPSYQQFHMHAIRKSMQRVVQASYLGNLIVLDDQSINQEWARLGSVYGNYATLDLTSASDSISTTLAREVLPHNWFDVIDAVNPPYMLVKGKKYRRHIFQTSGNGTTFDYESVIILAIALAATDKVRTMTGEWMADPRVYGDDLIIDDRAFDTVVDYLALCGLTVGLDKSFGGTSRYRESCGAEYWCGLDMSTKYFPRQEIDFATPDGWASVMSLQHRLYGVIDCEQYISQFVKANVTKTFGFEVTSSAPGTESVDLWEQIPYSIPKRAPVDRKRLSAEAKERQTRVTDLLPSGSEREGHLSLITECKSSREKKIRNGYALSELAEIYQYVRFLRLGPTYDDPLSQLLGVTSRGPSIEELCSKKSTAFSYLSK